MRWRRILHTPASTKRKITFPEREWLGCRGESYTGREVVGEEGAAIRPCPAVAQRRTVDRCVKQRSFKVKSTGQAVVDDPHIAAESNWI